MEIISDLDRRQDQTNDKYGNHDNDFKLLAHRWNAWARDNETISIEIANISENQRNKILDGNCEQLTESLTLLNYFSESDHDSPSNLEIINEHNWQLWHFGCAFNVCSLFAS